MLKNNLFMEICFLVAFSFTIRVLNEELNRRLQWLQMLYLICVALTYRWCSLMASASLSSTTSRQDTTYILYSRLWEAQCCPSSSLSFSFLSFFHHLIQIFYTCHIPTSRPFSLNIILQFYDWQITKENCVINSFVLHINCICNYNWKTRVWDHLMIRTLYRRHFVCIICWNCHCQVFT